MATVPNEVRMGVNETVIAAPTRPPRLEVVYNRAAARAVHGSIWLHAAYMMLDFLLVVVSAYIAFGIRFLSSPHWSFKTPEWLVPSQSQYLGLLFLYAVLILVFCRNEDLYWTPRGRTRFEETLAVGKAVVFATALLMTFAYLSGMKTISRGVVLSAAAMNVASLASWRLWKRYVVNREIANGRRARNVLIIGTDRAARQLAQTLEENRNLGYVFRGFVDQDNASDPRVLGRVEALAQVARANFVDVIFITAHADRELVRQVALEARNNRWDVKLVPDLYDGLGCLAPVDYLGQYPTLDLHREPIPELELFVKRAIDMIGSALVLILLAPVFLLIAIAIKLESSGPVFYSAPRMGKKGRKFPCYKFRSMVQNADNLKDALRSLNERKGALFKLTNDPRVTRVGKLLRRYSLDELPQFWNVLNGDMSLVGPRPPSVDDYEQYKVDDLRRLDVTPGITGLWQVTARRDPSFERNLQLDLEYIERWTPWLDIKILLKTLPVVLSGQGQ